MTLHFHRIVLRLRPDSRSILEKHPRNRQHGHTDEAEQARRPTNAELAVHLEGEERKDSSHSISSQTIRGDSRCTVERPIDVNQVSGGTDEDA